jgi:hypothetical protein
MNLEKAAFGWALIHSATAFSNRLKTKFTALLSAWDSGAIVNRASLPEAIYPDSRAKDGVATQPAETPASRTWLTGHNQRLALVYKIVSANTHRN